MHLSKLFLLASILMIKTLNTVSIYQATILNNFTDKLISPINTYYMEMILFGVFLPVDQEDRSSISHGWALFRSSKHSYNSLSPS